MRPVDEFDTDVGRYRRELLAHCYQMLGSVDDAEDVVQETMVRAWRARHRYDESLASMRTWLHRIATNACLSALSARSRRALPSMLGDASVDAEQPLVAAMDLPWLQPMPSAMLQGDEGDPGTTLLLRGRVRLAFIAALQLLPPRQRSVLILREVLDFPAVEVAAMLETSVPAVNSLLQRARQRLDVSGRAEHDVEAAVLSDDEAQDVVARYTDAFLRADVGGLQHLLLADAVLEMPPVPLWYSGRELYVAFMRRVFRTRGTDWRVVPTGANGQPALVAYLRDGATYRLHTLQVLSVTASGVAANIVFQDPAVFSIFDLAPTLALRGDCRPEPAGRLVQAVGPLNGELVDQPALVDHGLTECVLVELAAEPAERPGLSPLHLAEQANVQVGGVGAVEDGHRRLQGQESELAVEHEQGAAGVVSQPPGPGPLLGAAAPQLPVDQGDADACRLGRAAGGDGDHGRRVVVGQVFEVRLGEVHGRG